MIKMLQKVDYNNVMLKSDIKMHMLIELKFKKYLYMEMYITKYLP